MSTQTMLYQPQLSSVFTLAVYLLYAIVGVGFLLMVTRDNVSAETFGLGALIIAVICFSVYIRYQRIETVNGQLVVKSAGLNPLDVLLPRSLPIESLSEVNAIRMLPKDLRGPKAIPTYIEFKTQDGKSIIFNRWNYSASEITTFLQSLAKAYPKIKFNDDIQALLAGS